MRSDQVRMHAMTSTGYGSPDTYDRDVLAERGYMLAPNDWRNVEMTGYVKVNSTSDASDNFAWYARGGRHWTTSLVKAPPTRATSASMARCAWRRSRGT